MMTRMNTQMAKAKNASNFLWLILVSTGLLYSCNNSRASSDESTVVYTIKGVTIVLTDNGNLKSQLAFNTVAEEDFDMEFTTAGTDKAIPTAYAEVAPPFAGRVLKSNIRLGQKVD